jgi:hypothetical protein
MSVTHALTLDEIVDVTELFHPCYDFMQNRCDVTIASGKALVRSAD